MIIRRKFLSEDTVNKELKRYAPSIRARGLDVIKNAFLCFTALYAYQQKMGRVCINNRKLVESYFTALRRGDRVGDMIGMRPGVRYNTKSRLLRKLYPGKDSQTRFRRINLAF